MIVNFKQKGANKALLNVGGWCFSLGAPAHSKDMLVRLNVDSKLAVGVCLFASALS